MSKNALIHVVTEFGPTLIFFIAAQLYEFRTAAGILVLATALSLIISLVTVRRVPILPLMAAALVIISGAITYFYNEPDALIIADTVYYLGVAGAIAVSLSRGHYFLKTLFQGTFAMTDRGWEILSYRWLILLIIAGLMNETVRIFMTVEFWVDYRLAKIVFIFMFALYQFRVAKKHRLPEEANAWGLRI